MKNLLMKELRLIMHPTAPLFLLLSAMLLIPNYPYYVIFFYTALAIFFTCLAGRENNDVYYTMTLPVAKKDIVRGRFLLVLLLEAAQVLTAALFVLLRGALSMPPNAAGMDANIALIGLSLPLLGLFNWVFFGAYYRDVNKVGSAFIGASTVMFVYIGVAETLAHIVPFFRDVLDTPDPAHSLEKLIVLAVGAALFALLTWAAYRKAVRSFERLDV